MKILLVLLLLAPATALAYDTYVFRIEVKSRTRTQVKTFFKDKGTKGSRQPFFGTHVLKTPNTNYVLVKITPKNSDELVLIKEIYSLPNAVLWKQFRVLPNLEPIVVRDNSGKYPISKNWDVEVSSR